MCSEVVGQYLSNVALLEELCYKPSLWAPCTSIMRQILTTLKTLRGLIIKFIMTLYIVVRQLRGLFTVTMRCPLRSDPAESAASSRLHYYNQRPCKVCFKVIVHLHLFKMFYPLFMLRHLSSRPWILGECIYNWL